MLYPDTPIDPAFWNDGAAGDVVHLYAPVPVKALLAFKLSTNVPGLNSPLTFVGTPDFAINIATDVTRHPADLIVSWEFPNGIDTHGP